MARHLAAGNPDPDDRDVDLTAVWADDDLLDRLAQAGHDHDDLFAGGTSALHSADLRRTSPASQRPGAEPVEALLADWAVGLRLDDLPAEPSLGRADWALRRGQHRSFRPMIAAAAAIFVLLLGTAGIGSRASQPGDALWPLAKVLWSEQADSALARQSAQHALTQAREALSVGRPSSASQALTLVPPQLPKVLPQDGHDQIEATYQSLSSRVSSALSESSVSSSSSSGNGQGSSNASRDSRIPTRVTRTVVSSGRTVVQTVTVTPPEASTTSPASSRNPGTVRTAPPSQPKPSSGPVSTDQPPASSPPVATSDQTDVPTTSAPIDTTTSETAVTDPPTTDEPPTTQPPITEQPVTSQQPVATDEQAVPQTSETVQDQGSEDQSSATELTSPDETTSTPSTTETPNLDVTSGEPTEIIPASVEGD